MPLSRYRSDNPVVAGLQNHQTPNLTMPTQIGAQNEVNNVQQPDRSDV